VVSDHETERARHWFPTVDLPQVRPTLEFRITAPEHFTVIANGRLQDEKPSGDRKTSIWVQEQPCPSYLTCFIAGEFERYDDKPFLGAPISYFAPRPFTPEDLQRSFGRTGKMLAWITERLGAKLPWPKYYQFAAAGIGGAMENISLVSWDSRFVVLQDVAPELTWRVDQVNMHEMAHTWFGDLIVCRDYAHAWLKESWATYTESCWLEHDQGRDAMLCNLDLCALAYFEEADERYKRPIVARRFNHSWNMYDRHLYPGGACRIHMLRRLLGEETFWAAVRDYVATYAGKVVETDDFRKVLEAHSGRTLVKWFDQWIYKPGYPDLKVTFTWDAERAVGRFEIEQKQVKEGGDEPAFEFDLDVAWWIGDERYTHTIPMQGRTAVGEVGMDSDPDRIRIDPEWKVLHKLEFDPGPKRLESQLKADDDPVGRTQAGESLARLGRPEGMALLGAALQGESMWQVQSRLFRALGKSQTAGALDLLLALVADHDTPMSLAALFDALGEYRDARIVTAIEARLAGELPPLAAGAAYRALGAQRERAPLHTLIAGAEARGTGGFAPDGALVGLGATREADALEPLIRLAQPGGAMEVIRRVAPVAMGTLGRMLDRGERGRARDALIDLLRDENPAVAHGAVQGLKALGDASATAAMEAFGRTQSAQEQVAIDRAVQALRGGEPKGAPSAEKKVDELTEKLRKLEARLQEIEARD